MNNFLLNLPSRIRSAIMFSVLPVLMAVPSLAGCQMIGWRNSPAYPIQQPAPVQGRNTGAAVGGVTGGILGAAIGSRDGKTGEGALIGGLAGAVAGGLLGNQADRNQYQNMQYNQQQFDQAIRSSISYNDVIQMSQSGLADDVIARQIETQGIVQRPTTSDLMMLKSNGVSDRVIAALQTAWSPNDGARRVQQTAYPTYVQPAPVFVETWQPAPIYYGPPPVQYYRPYHHHHCPPPAAGFHFNF